MKSTTCRTCDVAEQINVKSAVFVCSASFESRCLTIPQAIHRLNFTKSYICENIDHRELHGCHPDKLRDALPSAEMLWLDTANPRRSWRSLLAIFEYARRAGDLPVVVDITAFTHEALLMLLRLALESKVRQPTVLVYNCAKEYSIGDPLEHKWLSRGVSEVRSVFGYPGTLSPSKPLHLIALSGFEVERLAELIRWYEPAELSIGQVAAIHGIGKEHLAIHADRLRRVLSAFSGARTFQFDCYSPEHVRDSVLEQAGRFPKHNRVVACLNTKLATVGTALVATHQPRIQLCYAKPIVYNYLHYSTPSDHCFVFVMGPDKPNDHKKRSALAVASMV